MLAPFDCGDQQALHHNQLGEMSHEQKSKHWQTILLS
jgi:hypothetical protein